MTLWHREVKKHAQGHRAIKSQFDSSVHSLDGKLCEGGRKLSTVWCVVVKGMDSRIRQNWNLKSSYYSYQNMTLGFVDPLYCIFVFLFH